MAPTVYREGAYRYFFFSREESRIHVHVSHPDGEAKFWLDPVVELANRSAGLSAKQLREIEHSVQSHLEELQHAWRKHFPS
jgi:Domain of unknown function (DUF4160)